MSRAIFLCLAAGLLCVAQPYTFESTQPAEVVAELELRSPGADWAVAGREAAVAQLKLDGRSAQHVMLYGGPVTTTYQVFLGSVESGRHELAIERDPKFSAGGAGLETGAVRFRQYPRSSAEYDVISHAPVLYARRNTVGRFSDIPMIVYCERTPQGLAYTVIFSNEDGGTSTRALMARWGRTTDIEYVYEQRGSGAIVQGPGHKDVEFTGPYEGAHPLLMPVTDNNMIAAAADSPLRFQIAPVLVDLSSASRESVMDRYPATYTVMSKELEREGKLRPFGTVDGEKISDQRNYLFIDYRSHHRTSRFNVSAGLKDGRAFVSDLGRFDFAIGRDGTVRTTVELPPGTQPSEISFIEFTCLAAESDRQLSHDGVCTLDEVNRVFFLSKEGRPGAELNLKGGPARVPSGQSLLLTP
jgi:hypothetical protein